MQTQKLVTVVTSNRITGEFWVTCSREYQFKIDHRGYTHNLSSCEIKAWTGFEPMTSAIPVQIFLRSSNIYDLSYIHCSREVPHWNKPNSEKRSENYREYMGIDRNFSKVA